MKRKLSENWKRIDERVANACERAGRTRDSVSIVAVTKTASMDVIRALVDMGVEHFGENRVSELAKRAAMIQEWHTRRTGRGSVAGTEPPQWHMVGHLQRNKVRTLLPWVGMIQSVDSLRLAEELDLQAGKIDRRIPILLEVNASGEGSKQGVAVAAATHLSEQIDSLEFLELRGLMTMAPLTDDESVIRHTFGRMYELFEEVIGERICSSSFRELSMGMSGDFEWAIEAGATIVRIGTALFEGIELAQPAHAD